MSHHAFQDVPSNYPMGTSAKSTITVFLHIIITLRCLIKNKSFDDYKNRRRIEHFNNVFVRLNTVGYPLSPLIFLLSFTTGSRFLLAFSDVLNPNFLLHNVVD